MLPERKGPSSTRETLKVTLLGSEWGSSAGDLSTLNRELLGSEWGLSAGDLSTFNRELAIHLSKHPEVKVSLLVPEGVCTVEDKKEAQRYGIAVVDAKKLPGYQSLDWLISPPQDHKIDVVIGHGVELGRQIQVIKHVIKKSGQNPNCKWIQVVHIDAGDLGKYKNRPHAISIGGQKHENELDLCKLADLVMPVGPRLEEDYTSYLRRIKKDIFSVTPGLFESEFGDLEQRPNKNSNFKVLLCGRADDEDFELKGYRIAAEAFADGRLKNKPYHLIVVGAPDGKQKDIQEKLLDCGIAEKQLFVRKFIESREKMRDLLCEVDLSIMPSKSEGFGLVALEALSAGLPILVGRNSGFARALQDIPFGDTCIVDSDDPKEWAKAIVNVRDKDGKKRLEEANELRESYKKHYSWEKQCRGLVNKMWRMLDGKGSISCPSSFHFRMKQKVKIQGLNPVTFCS